MANNNNYVAKLHNTIDQLRKENGKIRQELAEVRNVSNIYLNTINFICKQLTDKAE